MDGAGEIISILYHRLRSLGKTRFLTIAKKPPQECQPDNPTRIKLSALSFLIVSSYPFCYQ